MSVPGGAPDMQSSLQRPNRNRARRLACLVILLHAAPCPEARAEPGGARFAKPASWAGKLLARWTRPRPARPAERAVTDLSPRLGSRGHYYLSDALETGADDIVIQVQRRGHYILHFRGKRFETIPWARGKVGRSDVLRDGYLFHLRNVDPRVTARLEQILEREPRNKQRYLSCANGVFSVLGRAGIVIPRPRWSPVALPSVLTRPTFWSLLRRGLVYRGPKGEAIDLGVYRTGDISPHAMSSSLTRMDTSFMAIKGQSGLMGAAALSPAGYTAGLIGVVGIKGVTAAKIGADIAADQKPPGAIGPRQHTVAPR